MLACFHNINIWLMAARFVAPAYTSPALPRSVTYNTRPSDVLLCIQEHVRRPSSRIPSHQPLTSTGRFQDRASVDDILSHAAAAFIPSEACPEGTKQVRNLLRDALQRQRPYFCRRPPRRCLGQHGRRRRCMGQDWRLFRGWTVGTLGRQRDSVSASDLPRLRAVVPTRTVGVDTPELLGRKTDAVEARTVQRADLGTALDAIEQWLESQQAKAQKRHLSDDSELEATPLPKRSKVDGTAAASVGRVQPRVDVLSHPSTSSDGLGEPTPSSYTVKLDDAISAPPKFTSDPSPPSISPPKNHGGTNNDYGRNEQQQPARFTSCEDTVIHNPVECDVPLVANDRTSSPSEPQNPSSTAPTLTTERASSTAKLPPSSQFQGAQTSTPAGAYMSQTSGASKNTGSLDTSACGRPRVVHNGASWAGRDGVGANQDCEFIKQAAHRLHQYTTYIATLQQKLLAAQDELLASRRELLATKDAVSRLEADARTRETDG